MIVQHIWMMDLNSFNNFNNTPYQQDTLKFEMNKEWTKENTLRIWHYGAGIDAVVRRGKDSLIRTDVPVGTLLTSGIVQTDPDKVYIWDDPYWSVRFGKSCVLTENTPPYQLFYSGTKDKIHPRFTQGNLISKIAMANVLKRLFDIDVEFMPDADIYLLPSRNKFSCGFSRALYVDEVINGHTKDDAAMIRYEVAWISYWIDHDLFQRILPPEEYTRELSSDPDHEGINGILNEFPNFDRSVFEPAWYLEIAKMIETNPTVKIEKDVYL